MAYSYVVTSVKPTAISSSIICNFTSISDINLIIARGNRLEIHTWSNEELIPILDVALYGRINGLASFKHSKSTKDVIYILTEKLHFCVLSFDEDNKTLINIAAGYLRDKFGKEIEGGSFSLIDPGYRLIGVFIYDGVLKVNIVLYYLFVIVVDYI